MEEVILVNEKDEQIGTCEKLKAHEEGLLHRAFSVLLFNKTGQLLIHQRASTKYHCGGLWTNACCSHQRPSESTHDAAQRRLPEEMGLTSELEYIGAFQYKVAFDNGLTEHEYDHVLFGRCAENPQPNPEEVDDWKFISLEELSRDMTRAPEHYTVWFHLILKAFHTHIKTYIHHDKSLQTNNI